MGKTPEGQLLRLVLDWLAAKRILAFRMQSGFQVSEYKGKKRAFRYGVPGMADVLAFPNVENNCPNCWWDIVPTWLELKSEKGRQSDLQKSFEKQVMEAGHRYYLIRSLEDLEKRFING